MLFFSSFFSQAATSYSQGIEFTLNLKSTSIKEVCEEIERRSEFRFIFAGNAKQTINKKVDITIDTENVEEILTHILSGTELTYTIMDNQIAVYRDKTKSTRKEVDEIVSNLTIQQQKKQTTGKVVDQNSEPIIGANIVEKGTTNGTVTDVNGNFRLDVENDAVLQVSYIGYLTQEIDTNDKTAFNIVLQEDMQSLEELVVVGYGTQNRENLTGAIGHIRADDIATRPTPNITSALQGLVPGLNVKANTGNPRNAHEINLRGFNSLNGGSPLVLVDGIEGELEMINPSDIESITGNYSGLFTLFLLFM